MEHHSHQISAELLSTKRGLRAVKVSLSALLLTAVVQGIITYFSGSAALLADTVHGLSNAVTTVPLWLAFLLSRKEPNNRYTYGYHRAEDVAGIVIVLFIAASAAAVGYESVRKLLVEEAPRNIPWALGAGVVGFLANELVAQYRIKVGKEINSASLVADGHHARVDGLGSLAVVLGLVAVIIGFPMADPAAGLAITALILYLLVREAGPMVLARMMDRIDPAIVSQIQGIASNTEGVRSAHDIRARWVGHRLVMELSIGVDPELSVAQGHRLAEEVHHGLIHEMPNLEWCTIHVDPFDAADGSYGGEAHTHRHDGGEGAT